MLTNTRALIITPSRLWQSGDVKSYPLTTKLIVGIKLRGKVGDIVFGEETAGFLTSHMGNGLSITAPSKQKYGFIDCPNAKEVADYMYEYAKYLESQS